jgi:UDP-2,3-diacylglucosamine pyrophosphatase LpxH
VRVLVISDLHMGAGSLDDFDPEVEQGLVEFCGQIAADKHLSELVINGDFLDFVQAEPWRSADLEAISKTGVRLCFSQEQSVVKLTNIMDAHAPTFDALAQILKSDDLLRLTILPGNHDADIFWPEVRTKLRVRLAGADSQAAEKVHFHLDVQYRPAEFPHVWIEHGHQHDDCNSFEINGRPCWSVQSPPIVEGRLVECVGTRFLQKFLNGIDEKYPFVDNVKPFSKFVKMFLVSEASRDFGPIMALTSYWALVRFMAGHLVKAPKDLLSAENSPPMLAGEMKRLINELTNAKAEQLKARLAEDGFAIGNRQLKFFVSQDEENVEELLNFLSEHPEALAVIESDASGLLSPGDQGYLTLGGGFIADETAELKKAAAKIISDGLATAVVMGHTHEPVDVSLALNYVNTGSWIRYFGQTANDKRSSWKLLQKGAYANFPYELAYAEIGETTAGKLVRKIFRPEQKNETSYR